MFDTFLLDIGRYVQARCDLVGSVASLWFLVVWGCGFGMSITWVGASAGSPGG